MSMARFRKGWVRLYEKDVGHLLDTHCGFHSIGFYCLILMNASLEDCDRSVLWRGVYRKIKKGEFLGSYREMSRTFDIPLATVRLQCMKLENMGYITIDKGIGGRDGCIFMVQNWERHSETSDEKGWVRLHRSILKAGSFLSRDLSALGVYCSFLARAHWSEDFSNSDGPTGIECLNGQLVIQIGNELSNLNLRGDLLEKMESLKDVIWRLEKNNFIKTHKDLNFLIVTINYWPEMQNDEHFEIQQCLI